MITEKSLTKKLIDQIEDLGLDVTCTKYGAVSVTLNDYKVEFIVEIADDEDQTVCWQVYKAIDGDSGKPETLLRIIKQVMVQEDQERQQAQLGGRK